MDPKNDAKPTAPDDEQNTAPQTDAQQDAMPSLGDETVQGTDVGNGVPAPDDASVTPADTSPDVTGAGNEDVPAATAPADTAGSPADVAFGEETKPEAASEGLAPTEDTPPAPAPDQAPLTDTTPVDTSSPSTLPADQQVPGEPVPPVAPVPTAGSDKKTIFILGAVAVVLLAAIAVLYFV
jgi:hypothetical protein